MMLIKGISVSPGIAIGKVFLKEEIKIEIKKSEVDNIESELARLKLAMEKSKVQLQELYEQTLQKSGKHEAQIFASHAMILEDEGFIGQVEGKVKADKVNAEWAMKEVSQQLVKMFEEMENEYMQERAMDIKEVSMKMLRNLSGNDDCCVNSINEPVIIVTKELVASDIVQIDRDNVLGFVTEEGGKTSHSAIMARSMEAPSVFGVENICNKVKHGDKIIIDAIKGNIIINPDQLTLDEYMGKKQKYEKRMRILSKIKDTETVTTDGVRLEVACNIGLPDDVKRVIEKGGEGVGLFRTEFLYMSRTSLPTEEEQYTAYKAVLEKMKDKQVVIRTFDIGGDKELDYLEFPEEKNPFLGYRAIRYCLDKIDLWKVQLRAILRASVHGNAKLMFPMISALSELRQAKEILDEVKDDLRREGIAFNEKLEIGMMIETPAAVWMADIFAKEVDFFSIGTNDLIQYTMAVDRMNSHVSHLYSQYNPAVLRSIKRTIDAAHEAGIWVGMCGEAASDPKLIPILIGMGLDEFSMNPSSVLEAKWIIKQFSKKETEGLVDWVMKMSTAAEVEGFLASIEKTVDLG
jgi:phosphotransferase system enzyme I (PtsI)